MQLPDPNEYGIAMIFLPKDEDQRNECRTIFEKTGSAAGFETIAWRNVPTDSSGLGASALSTEPAIEQWIFKTGSVDDQDVEVQVGSMGNILKELHCIQAGSSLNACFSEL